PTFIITGGSGITIDHNTIPRDGVLVALDPIPVTDFVFTNNITTSHDVSLQGKTIPDATNNDLMQYLPASTWKGNVIVGGTQATFGTGNYFPAQATNI